MNRAELVSNLHELAAEMAASNGHKLPATVATEGSGAIDRARTDSLINYYGFSSLDSLEYLLLVEERFGITFEDEDLNQEILLSMDALVDYISNQIPQA